MHSPERTDTTFYGLCFTVELNKETKNIHDRVKQKSPLPHKLTHEKQPKNNNNEDNNDDETCITAVNGHSLILQEIKYYNI